MDLVGLRFLGKNREVIGGFNLESAVAEKISDKIEHISFCNNFI
jgi:hypothetical protein